ncbi:DUF1294 domain-containing protein [Aquibacillus saliphilus]|uniref:DUF1294 domain-containing protein n=1 Tax=Aquibacillus saliphilus TaxID=1909422 RepID=UPI001CF0AB0F|nr:DUF1294 domain-containing protein [Aquibacillus saliphilus]
MNSIYFLIGYALIINTIAYFVMRIDKQRSKKGAWRISEKTIWIITIVGGAPGSYAGMKAFKHKTKHNLFRFGLPFLSWIEFAIYLYFVYLI